MMNTATQLNDTDRLLDELESSARSDLSNGLFFDHLLSSLQLLVRAESASLLVRLESNRWFNIASSGVRSINAEKAQSDVCQTELESGFFSAMVGDVSWFAVPIQPNRLSNGCLLLTFSSPLPASGIPFLKSLCLAFAEVIDIRQLSRLQQLFVKDWQEIQQVVQKIALSESPVQVGQLIVNQLAYSLKAARVSMVECDASKSSFGKMLAINGVPNFDPQARQIANLKVVACDAVRTDAPIVRQFPRDFEATGPELLATGAESLATGPDSLTALAEDGTFKNLLAMKFFLESNAFPLDRCVLVLEWETRDVMLEALPAITHFVPVLCFAWQQQSRWMRLPRFARTLPWLGTFHRFSRTAWNLTRVMFVVVAIALGWMFLSRPSDMTIEADAILEPVERRAIFANVDGFLESLSVEDGQNVHAGQPLAKLRSPVLELQIEETAGQIRALSEKRNGLKVAINQISLANADAVVAQTRISADILLLEIQEKQSREKLAILLVERGKLDIHSPIEGVIVSRDLRKELENRPLRRGDSMFQVANLQGDWQLNIRVADRDTGYLMKHFGPSRLDGTSSQKVEFVYDSLASDRFKGEVRHLGSTVENPDGTGCYLLVLADLKREDAAKAHMGAKARAYFHCGQQPLWFVWCRPMIEALQKRVWPFAESRK